jgi:hypothetical protein
VRRAVLTCGIGQMFDFVDQGFFVLPRLFRAAKAFSCCRSAGAQQLRNYLIAAAIASGVAVSFVQARHRALALA